MTHRYKMALEEKDYHRLSKCMVMIRYRLKKLIEDYERPGNILERDYGPEFILTKIREARDLEEFTEIYSSLITVDE